MVPIRKMMVISEFRIFSENIIKWSVTKFLEKSGNPYYELELALEDENDIVEFSRDDGAGSTGNFDIFKNFCDYKIQDADESNLNPDYPDYSVIFLWKT